MPLRVNNDSAFQFNIRIYFEDTDAGGIVYHSNYLKYIERARTEMSRAAGVCHSEAFNEGKCFFVVRGINIEYLQPAYLDDELTVHTTVTAMGPIRMELFQEVKRGELILARAHVNLVNVDQTRKLTRIPKEFREFMSLYVKENQHGTN